MGAITQFESENAVGLAADASPGISAIDTASIDEIVREGAPLRAWPVEIAKLYAREIVERFYREEHFLFLLGLLVCLATILVDMAVNPGMVKEGAILRVLAVAPITLLGLAAGARRWTRVLAFCVGASPIAFAAVIVHLSLHLPLDHAARYLTATALVVGLANIVLPYTMRGLVAFDISFIAAAALTLAMRSPLGLTGHSDYLILLAVVAAATLPLAHRFERLRQNNFLLNLRTRIVSQELIDANRQLRELSERDPLTGMPNRRYFERVFAQEIASLKEGEAAETVLQRARVAVMMVDLDSFKEFNDTHGHQAGDQCLSLVARALQVLVEPTGGVIARYGGEEFIIALREREAGEAQVLAEAVRQTVADMLLPVGVRPKSLITASVGVALACPRLGMGREELIEMADAALYSAKRAGRNRVELVEVDAPLRMSA